MFFGLFHLISGSIFYLIFLKNELKNGIKNGSKMRTVNTANSGLANIFQVNFFISLILKNQLMKLELLGADLHISAIKSTIDDCVYHDHQISQLFYVGHFPGA